jgi:poly(ribitol-phosphate) beta-N-acetylglucosaminyltransferase
MTARPLDVTAVAVVADDLPAAAAYFARLAGAAGRFDVIAVTPDGEGDALDRAAAEHPEALRVLRSHAAGAAAWNAALEHARGRYVCLLAAGERPEPEALARLAAAADEAGADVVACAGEAGADVLVSGDEHDAAAFQAYAHVRGLAAARLFSRTLIEAEGLRLPEDGDLGATERFALRAMAKARAVLVVADAAFGDPRPPAASPSEWIAAAERLAATADEVLDAGDGREAVLHRVFTHEVAAALDPRALRLEAFARAEHWRAVADFADARLTEPIRDRLPTGLRVRLALAQRRDLELLEAAVAQTAPPLLLEDDRLYLRYPGFRTAGADLPDAWFAAPLDPGPDEAGHLADCIARGIEPRYLVWTGVKRADYRLEYSFALPIDGIGVDAVRVGAVRIASGERRAGNDTHPASAAPTAEIQAAVAVRADGNTAVVTARLLLTDFTERPIGSWSLRATVTVGAVAYDLPLKAPKGYVAKEGMLRGITVAWDPERAVTIRVRERATRRGVSRLKALLSDRLRTGFSRTRRARKPCVIAARRSESHTDTSFGVQSLFTPDCLARATTTDILKGSRGYLCSRPGKDRLAAGGPVRFEGPPRDRRGREPADRGGGQRRHGAVPR